MMSRGKRVSLSCHSPPVLSTPHRSSPLQSITASSLHSGPMQSCPLQPFLAAPFLSGPLLSDTIQSCLSVPLHSSPVHSPPIQSSPLQNFLQKQKRHLLARDSDSGKESGPGGSSQTSMCQFFPKPARAKKVYPLRKRKSISSLSNPPLPFKLIGENAQRKLHPLRQSALC